MPRNLRHNDDLDPRKQAKQARSHSTVQTILEGAAQVFEALGYEQTTTDKIAERAGVSVGSVYEYYPNKDSLLVALSYCHLAETSEAAGPFVERLLSAEPPPIPAAIHDLVELAGTSHAKRPNLHHLLFERTPLKAGIATMLDVDSGPLIAVLAKYLAVVCRADAASMVLPATLVQQTVVNASHQLLTAPPAGFSESDCRAELESLLANYLLRVQSSHRVLP